MLLDPVWLKVATRRVLSLSLLPGSSYATCRDPICFTPTTSLMSRASGKQAFYAAFPILLLCTLTLWSDFYGNHSGIPPESLGAVAGSFPSPMDVQGSFPVLTLPHGNQSGPNSTVISLNLDGILGQTR